MALSSSAAIAVDTFRPSGARGRQTPPDAGRLRDTPEAMPVRMEPTTGRAWCGERLLDLAPKTFAILRHFVEHPRRLLTKDELFAAVWGDTIVSESALTSCIRDLRRALGDPSRRPRYVETAHRRGFRFIGPIATTRESVPASSTAPDRAATFVGRAEELARLHALLDTARAGRRQLAFVTGEAGIGKTTLVETFVSEVAGRRDVRIARGQAVARFGAGEAGSPVLEALARLAREPGGDDVVPIFRRYAPTWLAELPGLLTDDELETLRRRTHGASQDRMLRELVDAIDLLGAETPLVLVLEDVQWSDAGTAGLLAILARRRDPARLLVVVTYRPADVVAAGHPLKPVKQELRLHGHCDELALDYLSETAVGDYLAARFPRASLDPRAARFLHRNTSGNPLFLVNVVDHLLARGHVRKVDGRWELAGPVDTVMSDVPDTLWQLVDGMIGGLTLPERKVLAVASIAGDRFAAALATIAELDEPEAERTCATLARRGRFLRADGLVEWPDGTVSGRYVFVHALYPKVIVARMSIGHRVWLQRHVAERLERASAR